MNFERKLIAALLTLSLVVSCIAGCSADDDKNVDTEKLIFSNTEYNRETDDQHYSEYLTMAVVDGGYYILMGQKIYYFDKASKIKVPLCTNIDCKHNTIECDAFVGDVINIWYYENSIYYITNEENFELDTWECVLYKCNLDGSNRTRIKTITAYNGFVPEMTLHRGNIYYCLYDEDGSCSLYMTNVKQDDKTEKLYTVSGLFADLRKVEGYGDGVIFVTNIAKTENITGFEDFKYNIMYFDSMSKTIRTIVSNSGSEYTIAKNAIYDVRPDGVHKLDLISGKESIFYNPKAMVAISYDDKYFYFDNAYDISLGLTSEEERKIWVVNDDGELIDTIPIDNCFVCSFGDSDYLFQDFSDGMKMLDKTQIGTGEHEWVNFLLPN